ncbi:MAG TPA: hypothetical protein VIT64_01720, partial [Ilumatobacteraceae bacterium]
GPITQSELDELMAALADVPQVILITTALPDEPRYDFKIANNALIYDTVATHPNATLVDWGGLAAGCVGDCFYADGIHMKSTGAQYYADVVGSFVKPTE